jgi:23S rRNA (cytidine1920-2'-O)/16S rRNA (cytidine1409-2'-O)-methyltransferase
MPEPFPLPPPTFVSRAGQKLDHALATFGLDVTGLTCADLGCSTGGFTDCLLHRGASRVFAVDTGYGVLDWKLRKDGRVVVMERTNAMHVTLPELAAVVTIDVAWTRQKHILPSARRVMAAGGTVVSLVKPHYEAEREVLRKGILPTELMPAILEAVWVDAAAAGFEVIATVESPIKGAKGNTEVLAMLRQSE